MSNTLIRLEFMTQNAKKPPQNYFILYHVVGVLLAVASVFLLVIPMMNESIPSGVALAMSIIGAPACMVAAILLIAAE